MGEHLRPDGAVTFAIDADVPPRSRTALVCNGARVAEVDGGRLDWTAAEAPGACRAEVRVPRRGADVVWLATNPVYARARLDTGPPAEATTPTVVIAIGGSGTPDGWTVEAAPDAVARLAAAPGGDEAVAFSWTLGPAAQSYAAWRRAAPAELPAFDSLVVRGSADRARRVWIQLRAPDGGDQRWGRSIYLDAMPREVRVPFSTLLPLGDAAAARPPLEAVTALLVVADTVYAAPGDSGRIALQELRLAR
jgi:hypothetical protein